MTWATRSCRAPQATAWMGQRTRSASLRILQIILLLYWFGFKPYLARIRLGHHAETCVNLKSVLHYFESSECAGLSFNDFTCLETDFHATIFSLECQIQEDTCQVEVGKATALEFGDGDRISWSEHNCFPTWIEENIFCVFVHRSLPSATVSTENYLLPTTVNQTTCESK